MTAPAPRRVLSAQIAHETNTFCVLPTTLESFAKRLLLEGEAIAGALRGTRTEIAAHLDAADRFGWTLTQPIVANATPYGKATAEAWETITGKLFAATEGAEFDGVILALHGAMVTETEDDAEGAILEGLRARLGRDVPIAITLDLHANVTARMAALADLILPYRTYPHIDQYETAERAAALLERAMAGEVSPRVIRLQGPMIDGCDHGRTQGGPMSDFLDMAAAMEAANPALLSVDLCAGFAQADIEEAGPSFHVSYDAARAGAEAEARAAAATLYEAAWRRRDERTVEILSLPEAMALATAPSDDPRPLVIADFSDNPGSGAYGDHVRLLEAMVAAGIGRGLYGVMPDPVAAAECHAAGLGAEIALTMGARRHPESYGPPVTLTGKVVALTDGDFTCEGPMHTGVSMAMGPSALFEVPTSGGSIKVALSTNALQAWDQQMFKTLGAEPASFAVVAVKSAHHFRAAFQPMSRRVILADSGALATHDLAKVNYVKLRRPIWPLDEFDDAPPAPAG
ncbi:MAG: M81 family metallopeptidase [Pseudomonadota bacterium]|nr:M81 family metallopeptidase [Pseudomonadota bacterium]